MKKSMQIIAIAFVFTLVTVVTGYARCDYAITENVVWNNISIDSEMFPAGTIIAFLPDGARSVIIERTQYFISGGNWFLPVVNNGGVQYQVVFAPV